VQVEGASWAPDGSRLAVLRHVDGAFRIELLDPARRRIAPLRLRGDRVLAAGSPLLWLPDGSGLVVTTRAPGWAQAARQAYETLAEGPIVVQDASEPFLSWDAVRLKGGLRELALVTLDGGSVRVLAPEAAHNDVGLSEDGRFVVYTVQSPLRTSYERAKGTEYQVFRLPLDGDAVPVALTDRIERRIRPRLSPDASTLAWTDRGDVFVRVVGADSARELSDGHRPPLSEDDSTRRAFDLQRWSPDGGSLLLRAQDGYWLQDPTGGAPERVWAFPDGEEAREAMPRVEVVDWSEDGRWLFASRSLRDRWERGLVRYDLEARREEVLVADAGLYRDWHVANDGSRIVVRRSDGDRPDEIWVGDGTFQDARALTDLNPWLDEVRLSTSELVTYLDVDGEELHGVLHRPATWREGERHPLVAEIYEEFFDNGWNYGAQILAAQGWFVLRPSVELEEGFPGEAWAKGVTTAINGLMERGLVDGDRLGVHGTSYGGYATNLLITQTDRFAAAVNISGKVNIVSFLGDSEKITTRNYNAAEEGQDRIGATLWEQPQKYIEHSAVMFADRIETPLLLLTGEGDWNVPATNTREMYYALRRLGKEVVWVNYLRAGHGAGRAGTEEDFRDHWRRMIEWYATHFESATAKRTAAQEGGG
jgi:dipeptidyl aminopeptidase/acylaminoacyl peptidase